MYQAKLLSLFQYSIWINWIFVFFFVALNSWNEIQIGLIYVTHFNDVSFARKSLRTLISNGVNLLNCVVL